MKIWSWFLNRNVLSCLCYKSSFNCSFLTQPDTLRQKQKCFWVIKRAMLWCFCNANDAYFFPLGSLIIWHSYISLWGWRMTHQTPSSCLWRAGSRVPSRCRWRPGPWPRTPSTPPGPRWWTLSPGGLRWCGSAPGPVSPRGSTGPWSPPALRSRCIPIQAKAKHEHWESKG